MAKLQTSILKSNNPIAPNIYITSEGGIINPDSMPDPRLLLGNGFEKHFFAYSKITDCLTFDSMQAADYSTVFQTMGVNYITRAISYNAFKAYVEGDTIHANGVKIIFDRPIVLVLGGDNITCEKVSTPEHGDHFSIIHDMTTSPPDGLIPGFYSYDHGRFKEWLVGFKLEGRKIVKIEAPKNSCNLYMEGELPAAHQIDDSGSLIIDFGMAQAAAISKNFTETEDAASSAAYSEKDALVKLMESAKITEGAASATPQDSNLDVNALGDIDTAE